MFAWEDVKAMFNGGSRKRVQSGSSNSNNNNNSGSTNSEQDSPVVAAKPPKMKKAKTTSSTSTVPAVPTSTPTTSPTSTSLLARLTSIVQPAGTTKSNPEGAGLPSPLPADYWMQSQRSGGAFCWPPYPSAAAAAAAAAVALPFHSYSYYNYLISKSDQLMQQISPTGWPRNVAGHQSLIPPATFPPLAPKMIVDDDDDEDDDEPFVDVESTL